jgi:hypothetical protein
MDTTDIVLPDAFKIGTTRQLALARHFRRLRLFFSISVHGKFNSLHLLYSAMETSPTVPTPLWFVQSTGLISLVALRCPRNVFRPNASILIEEESLYFPCDNNSSAATTDRATCHWKAEAGRRKKKHHFLMQLKNKLKHELNLPLSSAASNSEPTDPNAPNSLYNLTARPLRVQAQAPPASPRVLVEDIKRRNLWGFEPEDSAKFIKIQSKACSKPKCRSFNEGFRASPLFPSLGGKQNRYIRVASMPPENSIPKSTICHQVLRDEHQWRPMVKR